jgi:serine/threonine protein kinase
MADPLLGRTLGGKFTLESLLGTGAMGAVYRARHVTLDAVFAIKVMHEDIAADATFAERFHREARAASRLDHPNVIRVVDFGMEPDGVLYIVMEYVEGYDLFQVLRRDAPLPEARIVDLLAQALSGIAAAHDMGVVHRDLKPENIMVTTRVGDDGVTREVVKVCDFGIAQISEPAHSVRAERNQRTLTSRGVLLGTPQYMSPEQARGEVTDARTDIYSLGVILYQLLTGQLPFEGPTPIDVVLKHIAEKPVRPSAIVPATAPRLEAVCLKAMAKNRDGRFATARQMRAALLAEPISTPSGLRGATSADGFASPTPMPMPTMKSDERYGSTLPEGLHDSIPAFHTGPSRRVIYTSILAGFALLGGTVFVAGRKADEPQPATSAKTPKTSPATTVAGPGRPAETTTSMVAPSVGTSIGPASAPAKGNSRRVIGRTSLVPAGTPSPAHPPLAAPPAQEALAPEPPPAAPPAQVALAEEPKPPQQQLATPSPASSPRDTPATPFVVRPAALRVKWHVAQVGGGTTSGDVTRAVSRAAAAWNGCYEAALRSRGKRVEGQGTLRLSCDDQGRVVGAKLAGTGMPDVAACVQNSVTGITIANADTGEAWATVAVTLAVAE